MDVCESCQKTTANTYYCYYCMKDTCSSCIRNYNKKLVKDPLCPQCDEYIPLVELHKVVSEKWITIVFVPQCSNRLFLEAIHDYKNNFTDATHKIFSSKKLQKITYNSHEPDIVPMIVPFFKYMDSETMFNTFKNEFFDENIRELSALKICRNFRNTDEYQAMRNLHSDLYFINELEWLICSPPTTLTEQFLENKITEKEFKILLYERYTKLRYLREIDAVLRSLGKILDDIFHRTTCKKKFEEIQRYFVLCASAVENANQMIKEINECFGRNDAKQIDMFTRPSFDDMMYPCINELHHDLLDEMPFYVQQM